MPTPDFTLYHAPMTRSIRVCWTLEEMDLPYALETVRFGRGNRRSGLTDSDTSSCADQPGNGRRGW